jgi:hypothetical protein
MTVERLKRFSAAPDVVARLVEATSDPLLDITATSEWSARVILAHFRDVEMLSSRLRFERMLAEEAPVFVDFDEVAWAKTRNRSRDSTTTLLDDFLVQRRATVGLLSSIRQADWDRQGSHPTRGRFSVSTWLEACLEHDDQHTEQLRRSLAR